MTKPKLKSALDQYRGRNIRLEKQRKKEKEALKRKQELAKQRGEEPDAMDEVEDLAAAAKEELVEGLYGKPKSVSEKKAKKEQQKKKGNQGKKAVAEPEEESDEDEEEFEGNERKDEGEESSDEEDDVARNLAEMEDSDSGGSGDEDEEEEDEDEEDEEGDEESDIPLSDIESLASADREDVVPHQRLTINNTTALTAALNRISLPYAKMSFSEHQSLTSDEPLDIPDVEDDLARELAFYKQSLAATKDARAKLKKEGVPFSRPADYFAEMVKSDEHMGKIKAKLIDEAAGKKAAAEARRQRDLKKFGKQVQVAKLQERAKEKKNTLEKINLLKRSTLSSSQSIPLPFPSHSISRSKAEESL